MRHKSLALLVLLAALPARGATEGPGRFQFIHAARRAASPLHVDGRLDEPAWGQAPVFSDFVQIFPKEDVRPSFRTELRVLHDDKFLYVGVLCRDPHPERIARPLGRRDNPAESDYVQIDLDSAHDHSNAYVFEVTAGSVLVDGLLYQDSSYNGDWDAVWEGASAILPDGWSVELAIPLNILRYPPAPDQTWGFAVQRHVARLHEDDLSFYLPQNVASRVSRFGHLVLNGLAPVQDVELTPYAAARAVLRPQFSDPSLPTPRLWDPSGDVGLDLKSSLSSSLTLNATLNPEFGQVEADQIILNLTNFEQVFPEKRPFFTQGMDLFLPVGPDNGQMLFYSRRIGLGTPILGAAKLTGELGPSADLGVLDAFVAGPSSPSADESNPDRRLRFHPSRPFHLGPNDELPPAPQVPENYVVGVVRQKLGTNSTLGAHVTAATPMTGTCTAAEAALDPSLQPASCLAVGGNTAAVDWNLRTSDAQWVVLGQLAGSQEVGGPPSRTLQDGTVLHRGDLGMGGYVQAGKMSGEPFRFDATYRFATPTFDLNAVGYLRTQNEQAVSAGLHYVRPSGVWKLLQLVVDLTGSAAWTTDGRLFDRGQGASLNAHAILPGFHYAGVQLGLDHPGLDVREIPGQGVPFQRLDSSYVSVYGGSDTSQPVFFSGSAALGFHRMVGGPFWLGYGGNLGLTARPVDRLQTDLSASIDYTPHGPRYVDVGEPGQYLFGTLHSHYLSITLRQLLVLTPVLTVQAYAQLFSDFGIYGPFYSARSAQGVPIRLADLTPAAYPGDPDFHGSALNLNVVLRWEYRLGSTLYLVYTHSQRELPVAPGIPVPATLQPVGLFKGPASEGLLVKWSWWWGL